VRILLDTHYWLWMATGDRRVSPAMREALESRRNDVFVSAASFWETAIKYRLGKLALPLPPHVYAPMMLARAGFPITRDHDGTPAAVAALPGLRRDPFDRLLVEQALAEDLTLATADPVVRSYPVACLVF